jgi:predicted DNA-binding transcriptional regulator AlpA
MSDRVLRMADLVETLQLSRAQIYFLIRHTDFPAGVMLSERSRGWMQSDVARWLRSRPAAPRFMSEDSGAARASAVRLARMKAAKTSVAIDGPPGIISWVRGVHENRNR